MSLAGEIVFYACSALALAGALGTIRAKVPLRAAMALLVTIIAIAGLYLTLHAELLAAVQLLVYAGAVVVLFVFVIMLIGPSADVDEKKGAERGRAARLVGGLLVALVSVTLVFRFGAIIVEPGSLRQCPPGIAECGQFGGVKSVGMELFTDAAVPFELVSVLLTVAIVGAIAISRGRRNPTGESGPGGRGNSDPGPSTLGSL